jgi:hypothetical protein
MGGWGLAKGKSNYLLFRCNTEEEADTVADNGVARSDMHKIRIYDKLYMALSDLPKNNLTQWFEQGDGNGYDSWYKKDHFKNQKVGV